MKNRIQICLARYIIYLFHNDMVIYKKVSCQYIFLRPELAVSVDGARLGIDLRVTANGPQAVMERPELGPPQIMLHVCLFRDFQGVFDLNAKVLDRTLKLRMAQQKLHSSQILGALIDQRGLRSAQRVSAVSRRV